MAKINENLLVKGARGNVGKQFVYRKHGNDTMIVRMPRMNKNAGSTDGQQSTREQFTSAAMYAQGAVKNAELKKEYQKKAPPGKTAYNMALRDYLKAPVVKKINTDQYKAVAGSTVVIHAKDDFRVVAVKVSIYLAATGNLLEEGNAVLDPINRERWIYTATQAPAAGEALKIVGTATDLPGNEAVLEVAIP
ncbi:hypothetical protein [Chitinophaga sp. YIM B06452]|uniref:hypothetical protein n=1 Tax=Chitinophaga sp. YIM B06452 TaxID=3082158 RepID=UPI0031FE8973